jgi:outer membrane lipoprotein-sorting protein
VFTPVRAFLLAASAAAAFAVPPQVPPAPTPAELARAIQKKYDTVRDFSASFEHRYRGGVLRKEAVERGTMQVRKPSRMRWTYESPERKVFVADGTQLYSYIPEDRQVIVAPVPPEAEATTPALFLVVDRGTYRLRKLITADTQGGQSTFTFSDVRENPGIPDSTFRFTIPRGVDVVTHGQVRR